MDTGKVKWFNHSKGFGFIVPEEGDDLFVHVTNIDPADKNRIKDGDPVEFWIGKSRRGPYAYDVTVLTPERLKAREIRIAEQKAASKAFYEYDWDRTWSENQINHINRWGVIGCIEQQMKESMWWMDRLCDHVHRWSPNYVPPKYNGLHYEDVIGYYDVYGMWVELR